MLHGQTVYLGRYQICLSAITLLDAIIGSVPTSKYGGLFDTCLKSGPVQYMGLYDRVNMARKSVPCFAQ